MRTVFDYAKHQLVASAAMDSGAFMRSATTMEWDLAGRCDNPQFRTITARPEPSAWSPLQRLMRPRANALDGRRDIDLRVPCRKCKPCLARRASRWKYRAKDEVTASARTWLLTLTLNPQAHFKMMCRASLRLADRGVADFDQLPPGEQFAERHAQIAIELTTYLKRVRAAAQARHWRKARKRDGCWDPDVKKQKRCKCHPLKDYIVPLRYCLVAERHKSGLPHYHALIHEVDAERPVRAQDLKGQWKLGFSKCNVVADGDEALGAHYVAKYLSKCASSRVRASLGYGHPAPPSIIALRRSLRKGDVNPPCHPATHEKKIEAERRQALDRFISEWTISTPSNFRSWSSLCSDQDFARLRERYHRRGKSGGGYLHE